MLQSLVESENAPMKWQDSPEGLSPDWIFSNNSNVHVCNDRKWFNELTTFPSNALGPFASEEVPVSGVGVVNLPVKRSPDSRGPDAHHLLRLTDVLYMPSSVCNIVGSPIFEMAAQVRFGATENSMGGLNDASGKPVAYFSPHSERNCLRLSEPPVGPRLGPSKFKPDTAYWLTIKWPASERARWEAHGQQTKADTEKHQWVGEQPYTTEEKQWLKEHYGGEFKFLMAHELSIYSEEDRAEGRAIMRALAGDGGSTDNNDEEDDEMKAADEEDEDDGEDENPDGHFADYHFNKEELDWIKKHYGDSATFMFSHGLRFYVNKDCAAAKRLLHDFLRE